MATFLGMPAAVLAKKLGILVQNKFEKETVHNLFNTRGKTIKIVISCDYNKKLETAIQTNLNS